MYSFLKKIMAVAVGTSVLVINAFAATGVVNANSGLNIRWSASTSGGVYRILPKGTAVEVINEENGWYKVNVDGYELYAATKYIALVDENFSSRGDFDRSAEQSSTEELSDGEKILAVAKKYLGVPYRYGGSGPKTFDCSGFTSYVFREALGVSLPHSSYSQAKYGEWVSLNDVQVGDLLIMRGGGHVGIYAGNGTYIHAPSTGRVVSIDPLNRTVNSVRRIR